MSEPVIQLLEISKRFGAKKALDKAELTLHPGEILGLVGDNGAGKSTLLKILAGDLHRDGGRILIQGRETEISRPDQARRAGIEMVYQDLSLCDNLTVYENVFLGRCLTRPLWGGLTRGLLPVLDKRAMARQAREALARLGLESVSAGDPVKNLSGGERQAVGLSRCLLFSPRVVLLDEPTASMAVWEKNKILGMIRELKNQGRSQIVVSHNLEEILQVADRAMVLKEGRSIWEGSLEGLTTEDLARLMFVGSL